MNEKMKNMHFDELFQAVLSLKTEEEVSAQLLDKGEQYSRIVMETGASTATISRVNRCLQYGSDGYRLVLDRMKQKGE